MTRLERIVVWCNTGDNGFGLVCIALSPLFAVVAIGFIGAP